MVLWNNIPGCLLQICVLECRTSDLALLICSSKQNLKCVLLHSGNKYSLILFGHSIKDALLKLI